MPWISLLGPNLPASEVVWPGQGIDFGTPASVQSAEIQHWTNLEHEGCSGLIQSTRVLLASSVQSRAWLLWASARGRFMDLAGCSRLSRNPEHECCWLWLAELRRPRQKSKAYIDHDINMNCYCCDPCPFGSAPLQMYRVRASPPGQKSAASMI